MRVLLIDFYDSFTFNLAHYLEAMDLQLSVVRYDQLSQKTLLAADAIILSPGPGLPNEKAGLSALLDQFVGRTPILGVCLGMQALVEHLGGSLMNQVQVKHGVQETIDIMDHTGLFQGLPKRIDVGLYHSWKVVCPENWLTAHTEAGVPMALERPEMKVYGVQFHPESVLTPLGKEILRNFIQIVQHA
ncbi:MAG: aminodeoxychorismate/anthranilate synthase component II [Crocinitomicaceae bacterium]|nr:aminodeoxychorismate/anthranilate synthase component II [Crocinitomicaceae bacterium]MDP4800259.1 aminodeoxychorismate/anthranilate synthase component II [Crocinitomicaceae bacterium]MDP4868195.1 aminodeoxychorismate/anthranilate synthase component II [Crocinitomicaceae bacterium]